MYYRMKCNHLESIITGKFGALFASIPFTIFAAIYCVLFGLVGKFLYYTILTSVHTFTKHIAKKVSISNVLATIFSFGGIVIFTIHKHELYEKLVHCWCFLLPRVVYTWVLQAVHSWCSSRSFTYQCWMGNFLSIHQNNKNIYFLYSFALNWKHEYMSKLLSTMQFNDFLNTIFGSSPTVALIVAVFLDNTLEFKESSKDRGMSWWAKFRSFKGDSRNEEFYTLPFNLNRFFPPSWLIEELQLL